MKLTIEIKGNLDRVVASSLPKAFIARIFKHCMGKNNTPYFANNCFKGVLYFDDELAAKFAKAQGFEFLGWNSLDRFYKGQGFALSGMEIMAYPGGEKERAFDPLEINISATPLRRDVCLKQLEPEQALVLLGSVDKGEEAYVLEDFQGDFDPDKLAATTDTFEEFGVEEKLLTGLSYDGRPMTRIPGKSVGKNMLDPVMFNSEGRELDLEDFRPSIVD